MFFLGIASLIQCWFLPGFIILNFSKLFKVKDKIILAPLLSIIINFYIVILLIFFKQFNSKSFYFIFIIEIFFLIFNLNFLKKKNIPPIFFLKNELNFKINFKIYEFFIYFFIILFLYLAFSTVGEVIHLGDPVQMWNEWAKSLVNNKLPNSGDYPLGYTSLIAITYVFLGTYEIEFFSRILCVLYPLWLFLIYFRLKELFPKKVLEISLIFTLTLFLIFYIFRHYALFIGYVDPILFYISISLSFYLVIVYQTKFKIKFFDSILLSLAISIPAITKQTGVLLTLVAPFFIFYLNREENFKTNLLFLFKICILVFIFSAFWYLFKFYQYFFLKNDFSNIESLIHQVQGNSFYKIFRGLKYSFGVFYPVAIVLFALCLKNKNSRIVAIFYVLPYFLIWSLYFGNDNRNLAITLPFIGYCLASGCLVILNLIQKNLNKTFIKYFIFSLATVIFIILIFGVNEKRNKEYLISKNLEKQKLRGKNIESNILIYYFLNKNRYAKILVDDYNFIFLPETKKNLFLPESCNLKNLRNYLYLYTKSREGLCRKEFLNKINNSKLKYSIIFDNFDHTLYDFRVPLKSGDFLN